MGSTRILNHSCRHPHENSHKRVRLVKTVCLTNWQPSENNSNFIQLIQTATARGGARMNFTCRIRGWPRHVFCCVVLWRGLARLQGKILAKFVRAPKLKRNHFALADRFKNFRDETQQQACGRAERLPCRIVFSIHEMSLRMQASQSGRICSVKLNSCVLGLLCGQSFEGWRRLGWAGLGWAWLGWARPG